MQRCAFQSRPVSHGRCVGHGPRRAGGKAAKASRAAAASSGAPRQRRERVGRGASDAVLARSQDQDVESSSSSSSSSSSQPIFLDNYTDIVRNMSKAVLSGLNDGLTRMEVEFPPVLEADAYKSSSDIFIDANVQFAISLGRVLAEYGRTTKILLPDENEYRRSAKIFKQALEMYDGISMGSVTGRGDVISDAIEGVMALFEGRERMKGDETPVDTYIVVNSSCSELVELKQFVEQQRADLLQKQGATIPEGWEQYSSEGKPYYYNTATKQTTWDRPVADEPSIILMNLELETLRGDLGLVAFPPKDVHWEFLSTFKPVYFIRQRDYSKTITESPFLINYSGAIYREYPGDWQVLLENKELTKKFTSVQSRPDRYTLNQAKEVMMEEMGLKTEEEGSAAEFFRRGYKTCTWWEDPKDYDREVSDNWRK